LGVLLIEIILALIQYLSGGSLDQYLFSTQVVNVGGGALLGGLEQTWQQGSRVFATLGRYDILGSFLALGILMAFPWLYNLKKNKFWPIFWFVLGIVVLFLTASRASWLAAIVGLIVVGIFILKDKRVTKVLLIGAAFVGIYLLSFALVKQNLSGITEKPNQTAAERVFEAVSLRAWRESYYGYGRIFFIINTPLVVVPSAPVFGVGPGNYGGGVAAALLNDKVYSRLQLPFGIQNLYGQIDNSWFSLWGEYGTLGLLLWIGLLGVIIKQSFRIWQNAVDNYEKNLALGLIGSTVGIMVMGFFGPYFEFRTLMFYYWTLVGVVLLSDKIF
jgi:O-antigen ligase